MVPLVNVDVFIDLAETAAAIAAAEDTDWQLKYEVIFSPDISGKMRATGYMPDYCDPDGAYEDDVLAFVRATSEKAEKLKALKRAVSMAEEF